MQVRLLWGFQRGVVCLQTPMRWARAQQGNSGGTRKRLSSFMWCVIILWIFAISFENICVYNCIFKVCVCGVVILIQFYTQMTHTPFPPSLSHGQGYLSFTCCRTEISPLQLQQVLGGGGVVFDCNTTHLCQPLVPIDSLSLGRRHNTCLCLPRCGGRGSIAARRQLTSVTLHASWCTMTSCWNVKWWQWRLSLVGPEGLAIQYAARVNDEYDSKGGRGRQLKPLVLASVHATGPLAQLLIVAHIWFCGMSSALPVGTCMMDWQGCLMILLQNINLFQTHPCLSACGFCSIVLSSSYKLWLRRTALVPHVSDMTFTCCQSSTDKFRLEHSNTSRV